jgi:branched-chain amino acid transport system ATP-binding protein
MLSLRDLHAYYGKSHVLQGVDLDVTAGEIVSLIGRNGVGRSTTLKAVMGEVATRGTVRLGDRDITGLPPHRVARAGIAYVPEHRDVFPGLTVRQNLALGVKPGPDGSTRWSMDEMFRLFPRLAERANVAAGSLSGGEQQMLTMCRSLLGNPTVILVDEPTEGLAPKIVAQVADLLTEIAARGTAVLLVEQKLTIALTISRRVYVMGRGRIVFSGSPAELRADAAVTREWLTV